MNRAFIAGSASLLLLLPVMASAQSNPFAPRSSGSGLTKAEVEEIARQAAEDRASQPAAPGAPGAPGAPAGNPAAGLPSQAGAPGGSPVGGNFEPVELDPVAALMSDNGMFVGCVRNVPIFRDKMGRRIYFTSSELKESDAVKRYARC